MRPWLLAGVLCVTAAACGDADTGTSPSGLETATQTSEMFTGDLAVGGLRFYSFTVPGNSAVSVLLGSLRTGASAARPDLAVGVGIGIPAGTGCAVRESIVTTPALTAQVRSWASQGIHCVAIYDVGHLDQPVTFAVRLTHY